MIVNREGYQYTIGDMFPSAAAAALAHDRAILAILGPDASPEVLNFRAAFSDTELRFLRGRHSPARCVAGVVAMLRAGTYDAELARFAEHAFDAYMDAELAQDVAAFRLAQGDALRRRKADAVAKAGDPAARAKAERDAEREAFLEAARNKATDDAWVQSYCRRRRRTGLTFEDENRWPPVLPVAEINVVDWIPAPGEELIYLPHGSSYVDEMMMVGNGLPKKEHHRA
ncbi:hypothetical protein QOZ80_2AG0123850 [Eleusine coracana subsp. coracana]|nr:hypothetical protein QOZ80_2AG0123850 [Eleusine coracana subsp. coracana]